MIPYLSVGYPSHGQQAGARDGGKGSQAAVSARPRGDSYARLIDVNQQEAHEYQIKIEVSLWHISGSAHGYFPYSQQLQSKIADYESMTLDLERRLEDQALQCMKAENEAILIDKKWAMQFQEITKVCAIVTCNGYDRLRPLSGLGSGRMEK